MILNVLNNDAFTLASMTAAISKVATVPERLGQLGLFPAAPIRTELATVEVREGKIKLIQTSDRGEDIESRNKGQKGQMKFFQTKRLAVKDRIRATDLQFLRQFGTEDQVKQLQQEIALRQTGPNGLMADLNLTFESMRLSAIDGILKDADGTVLYDYFTELGITKPSSVVVPLSTATEGALREFVQKNVTRHMRRKAKGARFTKIHALCGENAYDKLHKNPEFRETFLNQQAANELRQSYDGEVTDFAGVQWEEYIGTDDSTHELEPDEIKFVPGGIGNTVFQHVQSPGEKFSDVGQLGKEFYTWLKWDNDDDPSWVDIHLVAYPLFLNTRPEMVRIGTAG